MTQAAAFVVIGAVLLAAGLAVLRVVRGPTAADRVVALDILTACALALCVAASLLVQRTVFIDVALGLSLAGFVGTLAWSRLVRTPKPASPSTSAPHSQKDAP